MKCKGCGKKAELRLGWCFDCASQGEKRAASRTVIQHIGKALHNAKVGRFDYVRFDLRWAWERMTRTGDYADGGYFDAFVSEWKKK